MTDLLTLDLPGGRLVTLAFGVVLLLAGRRIFWLVVGVLGFFFGFDLASRILGLDAQGLGLVIGVFAGILGVVFAIFLQKFAVGLAGFLIGGYLALTLVQADPGSLSGGDIGVFLVGGALCALLAVWLFEIALILLSSVAGAALVSQGLSLDPGAGTLAFVLLAVLGIAFQAGIGPRRRRRRLARAED